MMENSENLVKQLGEYLTASDVNKAQQLIEEPSFEVCFNDCYWDLITLTADYLNNDVLANNRCLFNFCEDLINKIAEKCPPEESLLQIIDYIETLNDVTFTTLLKPMEKAVLRTGSKLGLSVEWCFHSIHRHLQSLPLPDDENLEGEERKLLDNDPSIQRISSLYQTVLPFYDQLMQRVIEGNSSTCEKNNNNNLKEAILCSSFRLFSKPLVFMDLEYDGKTKSSLRLVSESIIGIIVTISPDVYSVLHLRDLSAITEDLRKSKEEFRTDTEPTDTFPAEDKFSAVTLGVYCYLIFGEGIKLESLPQIYNPLFILRKNLYLSAILLKAPKSLIQRKGLLLLKGTLVRYSDFSIPDNELESTTYRHVIEGLYIVAIYCYEKDNRRLAVSLIKTLIFKFDLAGRYLILMKMVKLANHSGIVGYLATLYKDILTDVLDKPSIETNYFTQKRISCLLDLFCSLPNKAQTDLVELSDQIISSLNIIRYLVIRDKENRTGIKQYVKKLQNNYFKPLHEGINLSRAHYKVKLQDVENERRTRKSVTSSTPIFVGTDKVPNLPADEKLFFINSALNGFDVMESLLCRLNECVSIYH
ncbi:glomulin-like isoform X1 [Lycorma delicatula]|uniref:glomulin-like isoform X1 n=1 Tax=Lycorma delicatula TaxID=130591 RepID=UPI003F50FB74